MPDVLTSRVVIRSRAPIRACDNGGWTDTWFAGHGQVFNIALDPGAEVEIEATPAQRAQPRIVLHAENFGPPYEVKHRSAPWGPHPLIEAALATLDPPRDLDLRIHVRSETPPGAGTGTSAAVTVALLGALDALRGGELKPLEIAALAHRVETEKLKLQCGIQDQIAAAHGGLSFIDMRAYPSADVTRVEAPAETLRELEDRLLLVYLGRSHDSSAIHETVIRSLENAGPDSPAIVALRTLAARARDATCAGDLEELGRAFTACTEAQRRLHEGLVGPEARRVIDLVRERRALGWKVNSAGGAGGSISVLAGGDESARRHLKREIEALDPSFRVIPVRLNSDGLQVSRGMLAP
jgi:D-glycero-alpha-D-manno-heptose-7-phosphate kinase